MCAPLRISDCRPATLSVNGAAVSFSYDKDGLITLAGSLTLTRDPHIGGRPVRFELIDRDVLLTGSVRTYYQKQMAQESLRGIEGLGRIVNQLEVVRG